MIIVYEFGSYKNVLYPYRQILGAVIYHRHDCNSATPTHHEQGEHKQYRIEKNAKKLKLQGTQEKREESDLGRNFRCLETKVEQPSTITCCDRFDRNCVNIDKTEPAIHTEQSL